MQGPGRRRRRFGIVFGGTMLAAVALTALFNYAIDPYGVFGTPTISGLNALKPRPDVMLAEIKFIAGSRFEPTALILGNSRADVGFDPGHPVFSMRHLRAYNAAVPGAGMEYSDAAFRRFAGVADIRSAVVGVDLLDFLYPPDAEPSRTPEQGPISSSAKTRLEALFSTTALLDSIRTVLIQKARDPAILRSDGFNPMLDYRAIVAAEGHSVLFRQRAKEAARAIAKQPHNMDVGGRRQSPAFAALQSLLRAAGEAKSDLVLVIYPYHVLLLLQYDEGGLWPLFEQWKTDLAAITDEARQRGVHASLWDFGCPSALTAETVPADGDRNASMQGYWEAGHFKKELGDVVLARAFGLERSEAPDGFGVELTPANVERRIRACRAAKAAMHDRYPSLAKEAAELAKAAASGR